MGHWSRSVRFPLTRNRDRLTGLGSVPKPVSYSKPPQSVAYDAGGRSMKLDEVSAKKIGTRRASRKSYAVELSPHAPAPAIPRWLDGRNVCAPHRTAMSQDCMVRSDGSSDRSAVPAATFSACLYCHQS